MYVFFQRILINKQFPNITIRMQIVASSHRANKQGSDANADNMTMDGSSNETATTSLFGKWQTEPWHPPAAVGGIVPKVNSLP
jgi:hypothetical protein